jgi:hypothetical protein
MKRTQPLLIGFLLLLAAGLLLSWLARRAVPAPGSAAERRLTAEVHSACSQCHAFPPPDILPRASWRAQIAYMDWLEGYLPKQRTGSLAHYPSGEIAAWYESRAPEQLPIEASLTRNEAPPLRFRRKFVGLGRASGPGAATVARLDTRLDPGDRPLLAVANMLTGSVHLLSPKRGPQLIGNANHPVRVAAGDFDRDGLDDLVISDLGNPMPTDELVGRVLIAHNRGDGGFALETVLDGVGRVADARPTDLDGDGDLDIVVAAFGWFHAGGIYVLRNETRRGGPLDFRVETITDRPGAVSVIPVDDLQPGAGRGFVVAFSQHYEMVSAFYPDGAGYAEHVLYRGPHPNWGVDNLEAVDLDGDSDTDFLLAHGDTLDDGVAFKPYHGIEWLENRGALGFRPHRIGTLYGAHRAEAADLDGDGDLDVVASGFLPQVSIPVPKGAMHVDSIIWFEHSGDAWIPRSVEINHPRHTGMTLADFDHNGFPDIIAAINLAWDAKPAESGPSLEIWFNRGPR